MGDQVSVYDSEADRLRDEVNQAKTPFCKVQVVFVFADTTMKGYNTRVVEPEDPMEKAKKFVADKELADPTLRSCNVYLMNIETKVAYPIHLRHSVVVSNKTKDIYDRADFTFAPYTHIEYISQNRGFGVKS